MLQNVLIQLRKCVAHPYLFNGKNSMWDWNCFCCYKVTWASYWSTEKICCERQGASKVLERYSSSSAALLCLGAHAPQWTRKAQDFAQSPNLPFQWESKLKWLWSTNHLWPLLFIIDIMELGIGYSFPQINCLIACNRGFGLLWIKGFHNFCLIIISGSSLCMSLLLFHLHWGSRNT